MKRSLAALLAPVLVAAALVLPAAPAAATGPVAQRPAWKPRPATYQSTVTQKDLVYTKEAFDVGRFVLNEGDKAITIHTMNEYMAIDDAGGNRIATFPDVIATLDASGTPLSAGQLREGMFIFILHVPKKIIPLSSSVLDPAVYPSVEKAMGIELAKYALDGVKPKKKPKKGWD